MPYDKTLDTKCVVRAEGSHAWFSSGEIHGERPLFEADFISQGHHQLYRYLYQLELRKNTLQNVALILFHGVSPNPLAPKVMVPKLTSRQRMFAYKADQIHRGRIILLSEWIRVLRRCWLFLREFHFSGDIACHTFAGGNCPGTVTMWGVSLDRWCASINTLTCHKYVRWCHKIEIAMEVTLRDISIP